MFETAVSRKPDEVEMNSLLRLLSQARGTYAEDEAACRELLSVGRLALHAEASEAELAAWTTLGRAVLNLNETYTRN
jgi:hypothetical protein